MKSLAILLSFASLVGCTVAVRQPDTAGPPGCETQGDPAALCSPTGETLWWCNYPLDAGTAPPKGCREAVPGMVDGYCCPGHPVE